MRSHWLSTSALVFTSIVLPASLGAWGISGHRIVARIAARSISPATAAAAAALLDGRALDTVATLPDDWRPARPETAPLHFVDIPLNEAYDPARDCIDQKCAVAAIDHYRAVLRNSANSKADRAEALIFLVHFVGDIHQPLHAEDNNDRGGNTVKVQLLGKPMNLHAVWDSGLINSTGLAVEPYADHLLDLAETFPVSTQDIDPVAWAKETHERAAGAYEFPANQRLGQAYVAKNIPVVDQQLLRAGLRLAAVLEDALQPAPAPALVAEAPVAPANAPSSPAFIASPAVLKRAVAAIASSGPFHGCPIQGNGSDGRLNALKNRDVPPTVYHPTTITQVFQFPSAKALAMGKKFREKWTDPAALDQVFKKEAIGGSVEGFLLNEKKEGKEACNCSSTEFVDHHLWLAASPDDARDNAMVVEISPRELPSHPNWTETNVKALIDGRKRVRISGWFMWDQEHPEQIQKTRHTLYEIHPIHRIEFETGGGWVSLDNSVP